MLTRRSFVAGLAIRPEYELIAHRGGVVEMGKPENSAAALRAARERGYWMVEVDVRRTKDGEAVLFHDARLAAGQAVEELTLRELRAAYAPLLTLEDACALCGSTMRLMLDLKGRDWPGEFYGRIWKTIERARVPGPVYSLGGPRVLPLFEGRVMVSINPKELAAREVDPKQFFLFDLASSIDASVVELARKRGLKTVAAINTFRYTMAKRDEEAGPREDFEKLRALGVKAYQIDSRYEGLFG